MRAPPSRRPTSRDDPTTRSARSSTSGGRGLPAVDRDRDPQRDATGRRRGMDGIEGVAVAQVVAEARSPRPAGGGRRADRRPRACRRRPRDAGPRRSGPGTAPGRGRRGPPGPPPCAMAARTAARAAGTSSACRTWNATDGALALDEQPGGRPSSSATPVASASAGTAWPSKPGSTTATIDAARAPRASVADWSPWSPRYSMPPTLARDATSGTVRPVRIATRTRPGGRAEIPASRRSARCAPGSIRAAAGSRDRGRQRPVEVGDDEERGPAPRRAGRSWRRSRPASRPRRSRLDVDAGQDRPTPRASRPTKPRSRRRRGRRSRTRRGRWHRAPPRRSRSARSGAPTAWALRAGARPEAPIGTAGRRRGASHSGRPGPSTARVSRSAARSAAARGTRSPRGPGPRRPSRPAGRRRWTDVAT